MSNLDFFQTADSADAVIIGSRTDYTGPRRPDEFIESITVHVDRVLKGSIDRKEITVQSWSGMCMYGNFVDDDQPHVMFLRKFSDTLYSSVADGCAFTSLTAENGVVSVEDKEYSTQEFSDLISNSRDIDLACGSGRLPFNFNKTVSSADAVIMAARTDSSQISEDMTIRVDVSHVFKGNLEEGNLTINIMNGT